MGNMCCRREVYAPNGSETDQSRCGHHQQQLTPHHLQQSSKQQPQQQHPAMSSAYHSAGDDCAINELLEGRMDLDVMMPDGRQVRLTVERRTPMMDLLVQAASATKISPGGHVIHVFGDGDKGHTSLQYKPSTPIGSLDTNTICIVPKKEAGDNFAKRLGKTGNRPFEPTFRVQVHLPRNQLTVLRVSPRIKICELKSMVCKEKGLDTGRYQLVRTNGPTQPLAGDMTLAEYGSTEITLLSNASIESHISTSHIIPYFKRADDQKRKNGILRLLTEDLNNKVNEHSKSKSMCHIDGNQKTQTSKTNDANGHQHRFKPKKRRPAPPPPPPALPEAPSHSRQSSSDSSGYHEATSSFLHEEHLSEEKASSDSSGVSSLDATKGPSMQTAPPPIPNAKKKKAPAPPPPPPPVPKENADRKDAAIANCSSITNDPPQTNPRDLKVPVAECPLTTEQQSSDPSRDVVHAKDSVVPRESSLGTVLTEQKEASARDTSESREDSKTAEDFATLPRENNKGVELADVPVTEKIVVPKYPAPFKDPVAHKTVSNLGDKFSEKDHIAQVIRPGVRDDFPTQNEPFIPSNHLIQRDSVLKRNMEEKLDLQCLKETEGQPLQPSVTMAAKEPPTAKKPADLVTERENRCEKSAVTKQKRETNSLIFDPLNSTQQEKVEKGKTSPKSEAVSTRVALVALNARIEQDVTQQEIASSIQAAFNSLDYSARPSLLSIKQRNPDDPPVHSVQESSDPLAEPTEVPQKATTVRVPLNLDSDDDSCRETPSRFSTPEREALLIDEEPPPRSVPKSCSPSTNLRRSSSLLSFGEATPKSSSAPKNTKRVRQLQRSLSDLSTDDKEDFEAEQERLQREYIKLQRQFILWQQQLMNNHAMLREECFVPQYARTLRQSHSLPEGEDYSNDNVPSVPLVSRSLSYEPTKERCSTLPRSAINITSFEFGSIPINNGTSTLRSSKTKSYFKPPQIRASTKSRQRLPPEIKKEGDVDITDDAKMLKTILPTFESLKLITENNDEDISSSFSRLKDTISATKTTSTIYPEVKKVPTVHQSSTFPKINSRLNNSDKMADKDLKYVNGDTGQMKLPVDCPKVTGQSLMSQPTPPPPPPPVSVDGRSKCSVRENCAKSVGHRNGVVKKDFVSEVDPREKLMLEIRKFGGRTALRKISLAS